MKNLYWALFSILFLSMISCNKEEKVLSKTELLTAGSSKSWNVVLFEPDSVFCPANLPALSDNTWKFQNNGNFEFDNGLIVEDTSCILFPPSDPPRYYIDAANFSGNWEFQYNETYLKVIGSFSIDTISWTPVWIHGKIDTLAENKLIVSAWDTMRGIPLRFTLEPK